MTEVPFEDLPFDGILGLGKLQLSLNQEFNLLTQSSNFINSFGIIEGNLALNKPIKPQVGTITALVSPEDGFWAIKMHAVLADGVIKAKNVTGILDTGSTIVQVPSGVFDQVVNKKYTFKGYEYCTHLDEFPTITLEIQTSFFTLTAREYIEVSKTTDRRGLPLECSLLLQPSNSSIFILGTPFLKKYETVFGVRDSKVSIRTTPSLDKK